MLHTMAILPSCPFGMAIEQLALDIVQPSSRDYTKSSALREQISILRSLRELRVWITDNNTEWESMSTILPFVLDTLPSPEILREVHVIVYKNSMPSERIHFLASVSKGKLDDTLRRFPKLSLLCFELIENPDSGYDGTWWEEQLLDHMPGLRGILPVTAKITRSRQCVQFLLVDTTLIKRGLLYDSQHILPGGEKTNPCGSPHHRQTTHEARAPRLPRIDDLLVRVSPHTSIYRGA